MALSPLLCSRLLEASDGSLVASLSPFLSLSLLSLWQNQQQLQQQGNHDPVSAVLPPWQLVKLPTMRRWPKEVLGKIVDGGPENGLSPPLFLILALPPPRQSKSI